MSSNIYGILLAGGKSSRMGTNKALLPVKGIPLIEHVSNAMRPYCREIVIVTNEDSVFSFLSDVTFVSDIYPGEGPLAGIHAGLSFIPEECYGFVMACDMPVISHSLLRNMLNHIPGPDAVICSDQPFHALYHRRVTPIIENCLNRSRLRMDDFLEQIRTVTINHPETNCFINLNTPEEYERYIRSL
jgi:molybdopterin-guanine dinucleotide biosynthesis protein A